ncbi:MAG: 50S ribosomal protein L6 [Bacilli bacterium]|nr:50S ribosomal protein L6 [Bacilli bacterium]
MARIGFKPVLLPEGVSVDIKAGVVAVKGPKGELSVNFPQDLVSVEVKDGKLEVSKVVDTKHSTEMHGTVRANIANAVKGVKDGFKKELEISGVGYKAALRGKAIVLNVGFSHEVVIEPLPGVTINVPKDTIIEVEGPDKQAVGQTAALIHDTKRPEPYGGKGIKYKGEHIIRKEGKRAGATGGKK